MSYHYCLYKWMSALRIPRGHFVPSSSEMRPSEVASRRENDHWKCHKALCMMISPSECEGESPLLATIHKKMANGRIQTITREARNDLECIAD